MRTRQASERPTRVSRLSMRSANYLRALSLSLLVLGVPTGATAQPASGVWRIGQLDVGADPIRLAWWREFRHQLREFGYVEGQNLVLETRFGEGKPEALPGLAMELVALNVHVIVVASTAAALAAKQATRTIPIVAVTPGDAVGTGLVASLARPGGNVTGMSFLATDLTAKQLDLLKEAVPGVLRIAIFSNPDNPSHVSRVRTAEAAAPALNVQLQAMAVRRSTEFEGAFSDIASKRAGALLILADPLFTRESSRLAHFAVRSRLPTIYGLSEFVEAGGLLSYGVSFADLFRRAANYVDRILKGAKPADLPVEQAMRFALVINLKTARTLGLTIPRSLLLRADQVIE